MASPPPVPEGLKAIGTTSNTKYYLAAPDVLIVVPHEGSKDDTRTATENVDFQVGYARRLGRPCATVVLLSQLVSQDAGARRLYAEGMDPTLFFATALVVSSPLSRAIGSFFLGLTRPQMPTRMFDSVEGALGWIDTMRPGPRVEAR